MKRDIIIRCSGKAEHVLLEDVFSRDSKELAFNNLYSLRTYTI